MGVINCGFIGERLCEAPFWWWLQPAAVTLARSGYIEVKAEHKVQTAIIPLTKMFGSLSYTF